MGVFINLKLSESITQEKWDPVYEKSLLLAQKLGFYDYAHQEIHGERAAMLTPTQETGAGEDIGWSVTGSFPDYMAAETQFTPKFIDKQAKGGTPYDILRCKLDSSTDDKERTPYIHLWGNKTQGEPYHMGLLAIGCVAEQMLGMEALVDGDITYVQCITAAELASDILGEEIEPPVCCRMQALHDRIQKFDKLNESEKLNFFMETYLGLDDDELGAFLKEHYTPESLSTYWKEQFKGCEIDSYGFIMKKKRYLLMYPDLAGLYHYSDFDHTDAEQCEKFIRSVMKSSLHLKEKDCYDPLDLKQYTIPYGIGNIMASFFLRSAVNTNVDRYIPLEEIRSVLTDLMGTVVNVNEIIDAYLNEQEQNEEQSGHDMLMAEAEKYRQELEQQQEEYDICTYSDLPKFDTDSKIEPEFADTLRRSFRTYKQAAESEQCENLMQQSADEMFRFLASHTKCFFLTREHWETVYDAIHRDKSTFKRYYPMVYVNVTEKTQFFVRSVVLDDAFWNYSCEELATNTES